MGNIAERFARYIESGLDADDFVFFEISRMVDTLISSGYTLEQIIERLKKEVNENGK